MMMYVDGMLMFYRVRDAHSILLFGDGAERENHGVCLVVRHKRWVGHDRTFNGSCCPILT